MSNINGSEGPDTLTGTPGADIIRGNGGDDVIRGGAGNDVIYGGAGKNTLFGDEGDDTFIWERTGLGEDIIDGGAGRDTVDYSAWDPNAFFSTTPLTFTVGASGEIRGMASFWERGSGYYDIQVASLTNIERLITNQYATVRLGGYTKAIEVVGSAAVDTITTGSGDDRIFGGGGNDILDGGAGFDTAVYAGFRGAYSLISQTRVSGGPEGGFDTLANIEALQFLDGRLVFSAASPNGVWEEDGATAAIARLYDTILDRLPDVAGLTHYRSAVDSGYDLRDFARAMIESPEFVGRYGLLDNEGLVRQLYRAVLNREVDPTGLSAYVQALNNGLSRSELVLILSESVEHRTLYQPVWQDKVITSQNGLFGAASAEAFDAFEAIADSDTLFDHQPPALHLDPSHSDWML